MGYYLNLTMKYCLVIICIAQVAVIIYSALVVNSASSYINLIELLFPLFELLTIPKYKLKCTDDVEFNSKILKIFDVKAIMLMYIVYCIIGFIIYIIFYFIIFEIIPVDSDFIKNFVNSDTKNLSTYIAYFSRIVLYLIGIITSIFIRHNYKKSLEIYQGFS
ncbi:hypothetical protein H8356DRAFT_1734986 [Neocallimastix lanati (nom. inval.)]|uniref:Uncharacterized protein n=1 Tax=Neocallimastix californiae TaxID=1754190 RepID=A0A1Y1Z9I2_9FUNG|nr:hypothetical protein H8356DRAFT_1734986 [Neocallimastix sp. JGI-2020a]ORY06933.1 hypothetical protein LY90DRAFT_208352 [Neocallimastix californiae]|eukprot:ORY06933.1 hypothetical protein LY90DRAFT_208352 [Neocallimastix californiae]